MFEVDMIPCMKVLKIFMVGPVIIIPFLQVLNRVLRDLFLNAGFYLTKALSPIEPFINFHDRLMLKDFNPETFSV